MTMSHAMKPLSCDPAKLSGLSEKLILSHYENNYGGAVKRLNSISEQLALIVRGADTAHLDLAPQAPGLAAISLGLSRNFADDHEMLKAGMVMYDALYAWCKSGQEEVHTWNPAAYR